MTIMCCGICFNVTISIQEFADQLGIPYLETSSMSAINVEQAMTAEIKRKVDLGALDTGRKHSTKDIVSDGRQIDKGGICAC